MTRPLKLMAGCCCWW